MIRLPLPEPELPEPELLEAPSPLPADDDSELARDASLIVRSLAAWIPVNQRRHPQIRRSPGDAQKRHGEDFCKLWIVVVPRLDFVSDLRELIEEIGFRTYDMLGFWLIVEFR
ncbi:MAG TPA: hypothetical protein VGY55_16865 [Pirellulales bacterium]|jgi:hypothetical protein|nr:hypothetical protein [Pirellulales bacterium]